MSARAIYNILSNDSAVTAIVGSKIYPNAAPQETVPPYLVFAIESVEPIVTKDTIVYKGGVSLTDNRGFVVNCYEKGYKKSADLAKVVRDALHGFTGAAGSETITELVFTGQSEGFDFETDIDYINTNFRMTIN